ncbi:unnamed protein product [Brassicogethes aeneus]|uniref:SAM domain-containing protein n=1 Tax=Brassicogethes aeneus TaxID=1431903 RepID=A0A9P0FME8_BRAAE|nr:unnamed protein product [Brassicogethes aeneus]
MEFHNVRDFSEFCEQLHEIRIKFHKWDSCERTVALYYLMTGLPYANAKFLHHALEQCISAAQNHEANAMERNANDPTYISSFLSEKPQVSLSLLLTHLPLLKPGNKEAADCYLSTIRKVLTEFLTPPYKIYNECVEIMSYVFIHPAFNKEDKRSFKYLLKHVVNRVSPDNFIHESSDESVSPNPEFIQLNKRSNSLIPNYDQWSSQENLTKPNQKQRSYSLSSDNPLFINSTLQTSSSETKLQDLQSLSNQPTMKSIISWLKSLRLHKYSWVFNNLTYEQILKLNEESLSSIGITKGARHKLLLNISKLKDRSTMLTELETEIMNGADLNGALKKIKGVLQSPLQMNRGEDLPAQIVRVMGKVCTQLLMLRQPPDECLVLFNSLCERAEIVDTFNEDQKKRLTMWKGQLINGTSMPMYGQQQHTNSSRNNYASGANAVPSMQKHAAYTQKSSSFPNMQSTAHLKSHRHSVGSVTLKSQLLSVPANSASPIAGGGKIPDNKTATGPFHVRFEESDKNKRRQSNVDIESSLESLCIQMMEHALGP